MARIIESPRRTRHRELEDERVRRLMEADPGTLSPQERLEAAQLGMKQISREASQGGDVSPERVKRVADRIRRARRGVDNQ